MCLASSSDVLLAEEGREGDESKNSPGE